MLEIERKPGQVVQVGGHTLRVLAVYRDEVVFALLDPDEDDIEAGDAAGSFCATDEEPWQ